MRRKVDRILFFIGVVIILGGFLVGKVSEFLAPNKALPPKTAQISVTPIVQPQITSVLGENNRQEAIVEKVVDGDTIHVQLDDKKETVRLIGVDTPEVVDPRKKVQCFGKEASLFTNNTLAGKKIFLEDDASQENKDKYQRLLRYVFLEDGTNFNKLLIQEGYAHEYTYDLPYRYQVEFKEAQKQAQENKKGFWADNTCF